MKRNIAVFLAFLIIVFACKHHSGYDKAVTVKLQKAGFGEIHNADELMKALNQNKNLSALQMEALMCVPSDGLRKNIMHDCLDQMPKIVLKRMDEQDYRAFEYFMEQKGYSNDFARELIKSHKDSTYIPARLP